jgi:hypothetical protein
VVNVITDPTSEIDRLDPESAVVDLSSGISAKVLPLRMRQLFKLLRIVTRGGSSYRPALRDALSMATDENAAEVFGTQLLAIAVIALPEAEDETVAFIQSVVEPVGLTSGRDKQAKERNAQLVDVLYSELENPDIGDVVTIIETVVNQEKDDLVALGKRLAAMFKVAAKTDPTLAAIQQASIDQTAGSQEPLPEPVISSPPSTDGPTIVSSTSPSVE